MGRERPDSRAGEGERSGGLSDDLAANLLRSAAVGSPVTAAIDLAARAHEPAPPARARAADA